MGALIQNICNQLQREEMGPSLGLHVVSAFNEAFNNLALHAYGEHQGTVELLLELSPTQLKLVLSDSGRSFDFDAVNDPDLQELPESGLGIFIIRSFMNEVRYEPKSDGQTNVLRMVKYLHGQPPPMCSIDSAQGTFDDA